MLLFRPEHVPMILSGQKTQTRRLWARPRVREGSIHKCYSGGLPMSRCPVCEGLGEQVEEYIDDTPRFGPCDRCGGTGRLQPFATVRILRVWKEHLLDIDDPGAIVEGYDNRMAYLMAFATINAKRLVVVDPLVWAVEFEVVEPAHA